jgi:hypothetical protein
MKVCSQCNINKNRCAFGGRSDSKDGLKGICVDCTRLNKKTHYDKNSERIIRETKEWRANNYDTYKIAEDKRQQKIKPRLRAYTKQWRSENPEMLKKQIRNQNSKQYDKVRENRLIENGSPDWVTE